MTLKCGTSEIDAVFLPVKWEWENNNMLLIAYNDEDEKLMSMEYEDLIGFAAAVEKIKFDRLKEDEIARL